MKKSWINIFILCLCTLSCIAQTAGYKFYSKLDSVKKNGFYNIEITPELTAHLKTDYSDIRVVNDSGKWIPHILHLPVKEKVFDAVNFILKFTKIENSNISTTFLVEAAQDKASNIGFVITNTAAERFCTLSGSNDKKNWFVINDSILLTPVPVDKTIENTLWIYFPPNNYMFYRVVIHNNHKDPLNIKEVVQQSAAYTIENPSIKSIENPVPVVQQKDSGKISYIKISQQQPFHFDNISLQLSGVKYFYRNVNLYIPESEDHSFSNPGELIRSFTVSNNSTLQFYTRLVKSSAFYLLIHNEDNMPLTVKQVKTGFSNRFITAYLETGVNYRLVLDNTAAVLPNYDLSKLNTPEPDSVPHLLFNKIISSGEAKPPVVTEKNNNWIFWVAIGAALLILLFFTYKMLTEVDKRKMP